MGNDAGLFSPKAKVVCSNHAGRATLRFCATLCDIARIGRTKPPVAAHTQCCDEPTFASPLSLSVS